MEFFSFLTDGKGKISYIGNKNTEHPEIRGNGEDDFYNIAEECFGDKNLHGNYNCVEYNPFTQNFHYWETPLSDDREELQRLALTTDYFTKIVKELAPDMIIKPFVNPLKEGTFNGKITLKTIKLLVDWMRIEKSMDVYQKVMPFFWDSEDDKWCTIEGSIYAMIRSNEWKEFYENTKNMIDCYLWDAFRAYMTSFFKTIKIDGVEYGEGNNPFQCCVDLWEMGLIPVTYAGKVHLFSYRGLEYTEDRVFRLIEKVSLLFDKTGLETK